MFTVYAEKEIFENIVVFNNETPNWYSIFCNHSEILLNISKEDLEKEEVPGTPIFEFINSNAGKRPINLDGFFKEIKENKSLIIEKPRSAFLLNISKEEADELQAKYGVIVQSHSALDDGILKGTFYKNLQENEIIDLNGKNGWLSLLNIPLPPMNSLIVSDPYLFANEDGKRGVANLMQFLEAILPNKLEADFHVLLLTPEHKDKDLRWCEQIIQEIRTVLDAFKNPYPIVFELVFAETFHKRIAISNYFSLTMDKGFGVFKTKDLKTVQEDNEMLIHRIFHRVLLSEGQTEFKRADLNLKSINKVYKTVKEYISNRPNDKNHRIMGDCNKDKSLKNRLINDLD